MSPETTGNDATQGDDVPVDIDATVPGPGSIPGTPTEGGDPTQGERTDESTSPPTIMPHKVESTSDTVSGGDPENTDEAEGDQKTNA